VAGKSSSIVTKEKEAPMSPTTYLFFKGNCAEAMKTYERVLGGSLRLMTYGETPGGQLPPDTPAEWIMHSHLGLPGGGAIMGADDCSNGAYQGMHGFGITLTYPTADETKRVFDALSDGGKVIQPLTKTFFSESFGMLVDRFGVMWLIMVEGQAPSA
jgi:PhnB protein